MGAQSMSSRFDRLVSVLTTMLKSSDPVKYEEFNKVLLEIKDPEVAKYFASSDDVVITKDNKITLMSLISTITNILSNEEYTLASKIDNDSGILIGFDDYKKFKKE